MTRASRNSAHRLTRRATALAGVLVLALATAACGDSEADQRKAFISFLQTRIIDKPGLHVPQPSAEETKSFGPYAEHYAVITNFDIEIRKTLTGPYKIARTRAPGSIQELLERRQDVKAMNEAMANAAADFRKALANTEATRAGLRQSDDLKPVYAAAFERTVTAPAQAFLATIPVAIEQMQTALQLADYLDAHRTAVKISGSNIQTADNKTRAEVTQLLNKVNEKNRQFKEAEEHLRLVTKGP